MIGAERILSRMTMPAIWCIRGNVAGLVLTNSEEIARWNCAKCALKREYSVSPWASAECSQRAIVQSIMDSRICQAKEQGYSVLRISGCSERRLSRAKPVSKPSERACSSTSAWSRYVTLFLLDRRSSGKLNGPSQRKGHYHVTH